MYSVNMPSMDSVARFKAAMDSDKGALGPFMIGTDPAFVEAAGHAGYDFVLLDMEHGTTTFQTLPNLIRAANVAGVCPVVRVPRGTDIWIDQALDVGAGAVMIPQIDTAEQARAPSPPPSSPPWAPAAPAASSVPPASAPFPAANTSPRPGHRSDPPGRGQEGRGESGRDPGCPRHRRAVRGPL